MRVYTTLDPQAQRAAVRALRDGLRVLDRRARGFVKPEASVLTPDGLLPEPLHLDEWDWPFAVGDVVRGVVVASDRMSAVVQLGDYRARLFPADVAWTRRTSVVDVLPRGAIAPFRILALSDEGGRKEAKLALEQEPKVEGCLLALDVRTGRRARDGRRLRLREEQVQPRHAGDAPGRLGLQADRLRGRARDASATRPPRS
jgi:membrane carboxypeptidase/penicillin-binding protein